MFSFIQEYIISLLKAMLRYRIKSARSLLCSKNKFVLRRSLSQLMYRKIHSRRD